MGLFGPVEFVGKEIFVGIRSAAELGRLYQRFRSLGGGRHILGYANCFGVYIVIVGRSSVAHDIPPSEKKFTRYQQQSSIPKKGLQLRLNDHPVNKPPRNFTRTTRLRSLLVVL